MGAVCELRGPFGDNCPLHVCRRGLGVFRVGAQRGVDGGGDEPPADRLEYLCLLEDGGEFFGRRGPCRPSGVLCDGVGRVLVCEGVEPPVQAQVLKWSQVSSSMWSQMHLVYPAGTGMERRAYHR